MCLNYCCGAVFSRDDGETRSCGRLTVDFNEALNLPRMEGDPPRSNDSLPSRNETIYGRIISFVMCHVEARN